MADPELVRILKEEGVGAWNRFVKVRHEQEISWKADLHGAVLDRLCLDSTKLEKALLHKVDLCGTSLRNARLTFASLEGADLSGADLEGASLIGGDLTGTALHRTDFSRADLRAAQLSAASLFQAIFVDTRLDDANFWSARLNQTLMVGVDLSLCRGLSDVRHEGKSHLDIETLVKSAENLPPAFLRGCGFADWQIAQAKLHDPDLQPGEVTEILYEVDHLRNTGPIQINPIFLSYAHNDADTIDRLHDTLQGDGVRCWRDKHELTAGPIEHQVDRAMRVNPTVVLVLSKASVESDWVRWEAEHARKLEREQPADQRQRVLCPIALDDAWKDCAWPARLRTQIEDLYVIPFHELGFDEGYARLKKGLPIYYSWQGKQSG